MLGSGDMTFYAICAKLAYLLDKYSSDIDTIRIEFAKDLRGEMTEHREE